MGSDIDERGQLILITGLLIAVMLVALVLLLNTVIYTQNLASRGQDDSPREALEFQQVTEKGIKGLLRESNEIQQNDSAIQGGYDPSRDELTEDIRSGIETMDRIQTRRYAERSTIADVSNLELHNGTGIRQPNVGEMTSNQSAFNWTLASNVEGTRDFSMVVTNNLSSTTSPDTEAFEITASNGSARWSMYVYENVSTGEPEISVKPGDEPTPSRISCSLPASLPMEIDLSNGSINVTSCSALEFARGVSPPYTISYTWGNRSEGTYSLIVNSTDIGEVNPIGSADGPYQTPYVYSVEYTITFETYSLEYVNRVRVAAG